MDIYRTTEHGVACAAAGLFVSKIGFNRQCIYSARCLVSNSTESHGYSLDVHYLHYASLTARSLSTLVTPQCNPTMCNRTSCAQVHELP